MSSCARQWECRGGTGTRGTYTYWVVLRGDALAIKQEADARDVLALSVAEGVHELAEGGCALDLEKDLIVVVCHFDVQVLALAAIFRLLLHVVGRTVVSVGHVGCFADAVGASQSLSGEQEAVEQR